MSFLNYIKDTFGRVLSCDFEFRMDKTITIPRKVVCACYEDIFTGEKFEFWEHDKPTKFGSHFDFTNHLVVTYQATAEIGCFLNLNHVLPNNIFDCFIETRRLYMDKRSKGKFSLLDTAQYYGLLDVMTKDDKNKTRDLIINNTSYTPEQRREILDYCMEDVMITSKVFTEIVKDVEQKNKLKTNEDYDRELWQIMFRGASQSAFAKIEKNGIPVDNNKINLFNNVWPKVQKDIIAKLNKDVECFEGSSFSHDKFENLITNKLKIINWPRLFRSGRLSTNKTILQQYMDKYPEIKKLYELRELQNMTRLSGYNISEDGRARFGMNAFGSITGRCQPSTAKFPFSPGKWTRNFMRAPFGSVLVYMDYEQQEVAIQGWLSKDQKLIDSYNKGDVYLATAKICKKIPEHGTKESHPRERNIFKELFLANSFGAGAEYVADKLKSDVTTARFYMRLFKNTYSKYYQWIGRFIDNTFLYGKCSTVYGWQRFLNPQMKVNKRGILQSPKKSIQNWPIQSHGAEVLRQALLDLTDKHFKVCATIHDAVLLEIPKADIYLIDVAKQIMIDASVKVIGGPIRVDAEIIDGNWIQKDEKKNQRNKNQVIYETIFNEIGKYLNLMKGITPGQEPISKRYDVSV